MEEIANLITEAKNQISEFEKFMFTSHIGKYITIKECSEFMKAKVSRVESMVRINALDIENTQTAKDSLNLVINKMKEFTEAFKNGQNVTITVNDEGEFIAEEIAKEEVLTKFEEFQPIETSAVKITNYEPENESQNVFSSSSANPEYNMQQVTPAIEEIPVIKDDTTLGNDQENFTDALDVQAIDNFLNSMNAEQNSATAGLRL